MAATRSELVTRAKARVDAESDNNISSTVWNTWADVEHKAAWRLVARLNPHSMVTGPTAFTVVTDTAFTLSTLTPAFWKVLAIDYDNGGTWENVPRFNFAQRHRTGRAYRVMGASIYFAPTGGQAGNYRIWYLPEPTAFAGDSTAIDASLSMYDELIVIGMAIRARKRQQRDAQDLEAERMALVNEVRMSAGDRDDGSPEAVADVDAATWPEELPGAV